ncbi:SDR family oxidoreductase [Mesorhizobium sp. AaZ16]|uniref:SDR family oxidoreductase n=1 Tax=Mesorhizobium sp. AaZ16 TaxID=3402289 RepID=UPI00374E7B92
MTPRWDGLEQDMLERGVTRQRGDWMKSFTDQILLKRPSLPEDFAGLAVFLACSDSDYFTGQTLTMDGGMVLL